MTSVLALVQVRLKKKIGQRGRALYWISKFHQELENFPFQVVVAFKAAIEIWWVGRRHTLKVIESRNQQINNVKLLSERKGCLIPHPNHIHFNKLHSFNHAVYELIQMKNVNVIFLLTLIFLN